MYPRPSRFTYAAAFVWLVVSQSCGIGFLVPWYVWLYAILFISNWVDGFIFALTLFYPVILIVFSVKAWKRYKNDQLLESALFSMVSPCIAGAFTLFAVHVW